LEFGQHNGDDESLSDEPNDEMQESRSEDEEEERIVSTSQII